MTPLPTEQLKNGQTLTGVVVSAKMQKTVVVEVNRYVKHPKYGKFMRRSKRYQAHDDPPAGGRPHQVGDQVMIKETRPLSRHKHFVVVDDANLRMNANDTNNSHVSIS